MLVRTVSVVRRIGNVKPRLASRVLIFTALVLVPMTPIRGDAPQKRPSQRPRVTTAAALGPTDEGTTGAAAAPTSSIENPDPDLFTGTERATIPLPIPGGRHGMHPD